MSVHFHRLLHSLALFVPVALVAAGAAWASPETRKAVQDGIALELSVQPVQSLKSGAGSLMEEQEARVTLAIRDEATGTPLSGLYPIAWMDRLAAKPGTEAPADCKKKVESFIGGALLSRPTLDLNTYYVLALNQDATISVVDPLFGYGNSKLLAMIFLDSPGEDWALSAGGERLFVSMPESNQVAVVESTGWKIVSRIETGPAPRRLGLQPDGQYLWAAHDSGVSAIDARTFRKVADIPTGPGSHDLTFSDDSRSVFVTNETGGTVSVIDVAKLAKIRDIAVGAKPVSVAWSPQAQAAYVVSAGDGTVAVLDGESTEPRARIQISQGIGRIRFAPGGRLAFVIDSGHNAVHILDAASNRLIQTADVEAEPDQVAFSGDLAYVRHRGSEIVLMIPLKTVGTPGQPVPVVDFPGGQHPPGRLPRSTPADGIVQSPGASAVLVANPEDKAIYYYKEGMAAPMGHFQNYGKQPRAVLVVDRSLREIRPGVYETTTRMAAAGDYELAVTLGAPRVAHCFPLKVAENPTLAAARKPPLSIQPAIENGTLQVGESATVRFKISEPGAGAPRTGLKDVRVLTFLSPGIWQQRHWATEVSEGLYEIRFTPPKAGVYFVFVEVESAGVPYQKSPFLVLTAERSKGA